MATLNVVRLVVSTLRERLDDRALLIAHFLTKLNKKLAKNILLGVSADTMNVFNNHTWPGNVRELEHAIEYASILRKTGLICMEDLPQDLLAGVNSASKGSLFSSQKKNLTFEKALVSAGGNKTQTAKLLGISPRTLYRRLEERCIPETQDIV